MISETRFKKEGEDEERLGLCTDFIINPDNLNKKEFKCQFSNAYRILRLPEAPNENEKPLPLVFIAHGTGIAPFISMLQKVAFYMHHKMYKILMVFGTRDNTTDFLFNDFLIPFFR